MAEGRGGLQSVPTVVEAAPSTERGRSSGVEHNLAKVGVEGSNPFARSSRSSTINVCPNAVRAMRGGVRDRVTGHGVIAGTGRGPGEPGALGRVG